MFSVWGIFVIRSASPFQLFKILANMAGIVLMIAGVQIFLVNRRFLPPAVRPPRWREAGLLLCSAFYAFFAYFVIRDLIRSLASNGVYARRSATARRVGRAPVDGRARAEQGRGRITSNDADASWISDLGLSRRAACCNVRSPPSPSLLPETAAVARPTVLTPQSSADTPPARDRRRRARRRARRRGSARPSASSTG